MVADGAPAPVMPVDGVADAEVAPAPGPGVLPVYVLLAGAAIVMCARRCTGPGSAPVYVAARKTASAAPAVTAAAIRPGRGGLARAAGREAPERAGPRRAWRPRRGRAGFVG